MPRRQRRRGNGKDDHCFRHFAINQRIDNLCYSHDIGGNFCAADDTQLTHKMRNSSVYMYIVHAPPPKCLMNLRTLWIVRTRGSAIAYIGVINRLWPDELFLPKNANKKKEEKTNCSQCPMNIRLIGITPGGMRHAIIIAYYHICV